MNSTHAGEPRKYRECAHAATCGHAKAAYKQDKCCGNPNEEFHFENIFPEPEKECIGYGLKMTTLSSDHISGMHTPADECYYPVTLKALLDAGEKEYTYIGQSHTNEHAPDGAYVYKMDDGSLRYKKIELTAGSCDGADLCFTCDHTLPMLTDFKDAKLLGKAMTCSSDVISVDALKGEYSHYAWVQFPGQGCGSFLYQRPDGLPMVHKTCG